MSPLLQIQTFGNTLSLNPLSLHALAVGGGGPAHPARGPYLCARLPAFRCGVLQMGDGLDPEDLADKGIFGRNPHKPCSKCGAWLIALGPS